jgi:putative ABC transport system permease protein
MEKQPTLLLGIALFIVVIAWVNYINLATARAITRAREVGVRKAIGSQRRQLIVQFLSESALLEWTCAGARTNYRIDRHSRIQFTFRSNSNLTRCLRIPSFWIGLVSLFFRWRFLFRSLSRIRPFGIQAD